MADRWNGRGKKNREDVPSSEKKTYDPASPFLTYSKALGPPSAPSEWNIPSPTSGSHLSSPTPQPFAPSYPGSYTASSSANSPIWQAAQGLGYSPYRPTNPSQATYDGLSANFNLDAGGSLSHMQVNQDRAGEAPKNYLSPSAGSSQPLPQSERYSSNTRLGTAGQPMSPIFPPERLGAASWGLDPRSSLRHSMIEDQHDDGRRGSKIFVCSFCCKCFDRPSTLATHRLSHTGEKPHTCTKCGKSFSVASNLRRHEQSIHAPKPKSELVSPPPGMGPPRNGIVGSTPSSVLYQRGYEVYENLLPLSHRPSSGSTSLNNPNQTLPQSSDKQHL